MFEINEGKTYLYLDEKIEGFSNIGIGLITRAIGQGVSISYIDTKNSAKKWTNFIENLSMSYSFVKSIQKINIGIYSPKNENIITKTIVPAVEYLNITNDMFWKDLENSDLVIFDNFDFEIFKKIKLISLIKNKNFRTQIVVITKDKNIIKELKDEFNFIIKCEYKKNSGLGVVKGITNITGNGNGKSVYAYGELLRKFLYKGDVKLIYFDKAEDLYGDVTFFKHLKKWQKEHNLYGVFDYVQNGTKRNITEEDLIKKEAEEALMLFKTSLKKQSPVIADELNNLIERNIIDDQEVINILRETKGEVIITGNKSTKKIKDISETLIEFEYLKK